MALKIDPPLCGIPVQRYEHIVLGHGGGGQLTADLVRRLFVPAFRNEMLERLEDQAALKLTGTPADVRLAFTTDAFTVRPIFFPGGDIGSLSVFGTVNDLAVGGAIPLFISAAFILEEGFALSNLRAVVESMRNACERSGVELVTGDTKVVEKGKGDGIFITTSGIGLITDGVHLSIHNARPGDKILVSGTIGDHGIAVMAARHSLDFDPPIQSDAASVAELCRMALATTKVVRAMRDPTRGGLAATCIELAEASQVGVELFEAMVPVKPSVHAACEILGLEPLHVANEGKLVVVVAAEDADEVVSAMRKHPMGIDAAVVGEVTDQHPGMVTVRSRIGGRRILLLPSGEQLPRIC
jgi:hydrogenase expression/formation protein HypE